MTPASAVERLWYGPAWRAWLFAPLEALYRAVMRLRRLAYSAGLRRSQRAGAPVIVVGNLTVGGTGKTPVAAWLARRLRERGLRVGIVLRGYGGSHAGPPERVDADGDPGRVGDEAVLHVLQGTTIVIVGRDRLLAARRAVEEGAQVVVCDDGLQHLALERDCEIVVVDPDRVFGNGHCLPAGPLREPAARLASVDAVVCVSRGRGVAPPFDVPATCAITARYRLGHAVNLASGERRPLRAFSGERVRAVAGIGHPAAFFDALQAAGLDIDRRPLPDHVGVARLLDELEGPGTVIMTGKDAVKCRRSARPGWWYVELELQFDDDDASRLLDVVGRRIGL